MWIGVLWAGLRVAMWITHVEGKFRHGLLEKSPNNSLSNYLCNWQFVTDAFCAMETQAHANMISLENLFCDCKMFSFLST